MLGARTAAFIGLLALPGCLLTDSLSNLTGASSAGDGGVHGADSGADGGVEAGVDAARSDAGADADASGDGPAVAPIRYVQIDANQTTTTVLTLALKGVGAHDALIIAVHVNGATLSPVTDTQGNAFQQVIGPATGPNGDHYVFATYDVAAGDDTVSLLATQTASPFEGYLAEYAGLATSMAFDQANYMSGTSMALDGMTSGPVTTTAPNELLFGFGEGGTTAAGTGFTARSLYNGNVIEDRVVSQAGVYGATATETSTSGSWTMALATFKGL
jgi:hypothetical protein